jgi:hypothetical protein
MEVVPWENFQAPFFLSNLTKYSKYSKFFCLGRLVRVAISSFSPQGSWSLRITRSKSYPMVFFFHPFCLRKRRKICEKHWISDLWVERGDFDITFLSLKIFLLLGNVLQLCWASGYIQFVAPIWCYINCLKSWHNK